MSVCEIGKGIISISTCMVFFFVILFNFLFQTGFLFGNKSVSIGKHKAELAGVTKRQLIRQV